MAKRRRTEPKTIPKTGDDVWDDAMKKSQKKWSKEDPDIDMDKVIRDGLKKSANVQCPVGVFAVANYVPGYLEHLDDGTTKTNVLNDGKSVMLQFPKDAADMPQTFLTFFKELRLLCKGHDNAIAGGTMGIVLPDGTIYSFDDAGLPVGDCWAEN